MHVHDWVPEIVVHVGEGLVSQDTGVVDHDIYAAKGIDGTLDDCVTILGRGLDTDSLAAHLLDLLDNGIRVHEIVDHDGSTVAGKCQGVRPADTSTTTSDNGDAASEVKLLALLAGAHLHGLLKKSHEVVGSGRVLWLGEVDNLVPLLEDRSGCVGVVGLEEETAGALPAKLGHMAGTDLEDATGLTCVVLVHEGSHQGHDPVGLQVLQHIRRHDSLGHAASGDGSNDVADNVVLETLLGQGLGEANQGQLGGGVVGLAKVSEQAGGGGGVDDTAILLLPEVGPGGAGALVGALDVDLVDEVPVLVGHVLEADVAQDACVVEEDVDAAESRDGGLDDALAVLDAVVVGDGLAAGSLDLVDDQIGSLRGFVS